ncbi:hypothetical protein D1872_264800 [compost metagenome]
MPDRIVQFPGQTVAFLQQRHLFDLGRILLQDRVLLFHNGKLVADVVNGGRSLLQGKTDAVKHQRVRYALPPKGAL